ncbi:phosphopantothenoylcysteine decarboxylase, partial [Ligilactobacillus salivarius]
VSDYHVAKVANNKIKKTGEKLTLELVQNPDILKGLGSVKEKQILVGFAAETNNLYENAQNKLLSKHADMIVGNDVSRKDIGFGNDDNEVTLFTLKNSPIKLLKTNKKELSHKILDVIVEKLMSKE